ncbi:nucleoside diphosphate kinase 2 [Hibiscus syriacus]|uniref:Nucleoside diphosphate kinase 2 n=1 Tax=Hibiscus syriacus TaxID=106335 RepID=A0A6A2WL01_HIBSY|nr:nucleoside diphosphate kinase 2 [Hibiscus syriacus]
MSKDVEDPVNDGLEVLALLDTASQLLFSIINKWAVMKFPYPGALTALQYLTSGAGVLICGWFKVIEHDRLDLRLWRFLPAAIIFYLSLFTNSELLLHANVDTFIVFDQQFPCLLQWEDSFLAPTMAFIEDMGLWPPSLEAVFFMFLLITSSHYCLYLGVAYLVSMSIDFVYIKHVVMTIDLNTWGLVLYNNLEALLLFPLELLIMGELKKISMKSQMSPIGTLLKWFCLWACRVYLGCPYLSLGFLAEGKFLLQVVMYQQSTSNNPKAVNVATARDRGTTELLEMQSNTGKEHKKEVTEI